MSAPATGWTGADALGPPSGVSFTAQRIAAWCGPTFMVLTGVGFMVVAGFIPPVPPSDTAQQVADRFIDHQNAIRAGILLALFAAALLCPWYAVTSMMARRIAGPNSPWSRTYLIGGTVNACAFMIPYMTWLTAAFRPEESSPELTQRLDDLGWIPWIGMASPAIMQGVVLAVVILQDHREVPLLPRWVGYLSALSAMSLIPPTFLVFFKTGPLAWNGLAFYISLVCWPTWLFALSITLVRAITRVEREGTAVTEAGPASGPLDVEAELVSLRLRISRLERQQSTPSRPG